jgi:hypothetical protein
MDCLMKYVATFGDESIEFQRLDTAEMFRQLGRIPQNAVIARVPDADDVRAEAQRRMMRFVGARSAADLANKISNAIREATRLNDARLSAAEGTGPAPSEADTLRSTQLRQADAAIEAIRAASNAMEAQPPSDFDDDGHWPNL